MLILMSGRSEESIACSKQVQYWRPWRMENNHQEATQMTHQMMDRGKCQNQIIHKKKKRKMHLYNHHQPILLWISIIWVYKIINKFHKCLQWQMIRLPQLVRILEKSNRLNLRALLLVLLSNHKSFNLHQCNHQYTNLSQWTQWEEACQVMDNSLLWVDFQVKDFNLRWEVEWVCQVVCLPHNLLAYKFRHQIILD